MADYWKSLPRKFCDICKCWFADNKASIDFHEKGKRHQENVKKRINELQKKGLKEYEAQKNLENEMKKIEQAALKAYKKDLEKNPELAGQFIENVANKESEPGGESLEKEENYEEKEDSPHSVATPEKTVEKEWYEAMSEEGHTYYWNINTSASQWEPPEDGYMSIEEQQQAQTVDEHAVDEHSTEHDEENSKSEKDEEEKDEEEKDEEEKDDESEEVSDNEIPADAIGPQPKPNPYGQWVAVEHLVEDPVDLELPEKSDDIVEMHIPLTNEESRIKIKEKIIGHLDDSFSSENSVFKKRKNISGFKRNVRQRLKEDD